MISYKITAQSPFKVFFSVLYSSVLYDRYTCVYIYNIHICVSTYNFPYIPIVTQTRWKQKHQIVLGCYCASKRNCVQNFINLGVPLFWTTHFSRYFLVKSSPWRRRLLQPEEGLEDGARRVPAVRDIPRLHQDGTTTRPLSWRKTTVVTYIYNHPAKKNDIFIHFQQDSKVFFSDLSK